MNTRKLIKYIINSFMAVSIVFFVSCNGGGGANDTSPPDDVSDLQAVAGDFNVTLMWNEPGNADYAYAEIAWSPANGIAQPVQVNKGTNYTEITKLAGGTEYTFTVKTADADDNISNGKSISATTLVWKPDAGFGSSGVVIEDINAAGADNYLNSMVIDSNGKIVVTGSGNFGGGGYIMYVGRYNSDGILDTGFATNGFFVESAASIGRDVAIDSSGRILVAGRRYNGGDNDAAVWRFNQDGSPDTTFNGSGYVVHDISGGEDGIQGMVIDSSGRIVVSGYSDNGSNYDMAIWRFNQDGSLDTANFNSPDGFVTHDNAAGGSKNDIGLAIALDKSGRLVVTGKSNDIASNSDLIVWRFNSNGSLDTSFDSDGFAVWDNTGGNDEGQDVSVDEAGRILVSGYSVFPGNLKDMVIRRYTTTGSVDMSFGNNGVVSYNYNGGDDAGYGMTINSDGNILVAGIVHDTNIDMALWMYDSDGSPVTSFGTDGIFKKDQGGGQDEGITVLIDPQGRILVGGDFVNGANRDIAIWRYAAE